MLLKSVVQSDMAEKGSCTFKNIQHVHFHFGCGAAATVTLLPIYQPRRSFAFETIRHVTMCPTFVVASGRTHDLTSPSSHLQGSPHPFFSLLLNNPFPKHQCRPSTQRRTHSRTDDRQRAPRTRHRCHVLFNGIKVVPRAEKPRCRE